MSDLNPSSTPANSSELIELKEICADLQWQTHTLRIALLVVSCVLCGFFFVEVRRNGLALQTLRPQAAQVVNVSKETDPIAARVITQFLDYGKTHPDFNPILSKYAAGFGMFGIRVTQSPAPVAPAIAVPKK